MQARKIRPDEMHKIDLINCVAFESPWEPPKPEAEAEKKEPDSTTQWWISEEGDVFCGCLLVFKLNVRFDGHMTGMSGIGGVATLPQHRRRGAIRACMNASLADMRERGDVFSVLYPFSRAYYRQFGYEDGESMVRWTMPFASMKLPEAGGTMQLILPGDDLSPVHEVYNACAENWNLAAAPSRWLTRLDGQSWMKDKRYLYLWRDENGVPGGFMLFSKSGGVMNCTASFGLENALMFRDVRALTALLRFAKGFAADYESIRFDVPQGVRVQSLISEGNDVKGELVYNGMVRLVNVKRALELCRTEGEGSIVLSVADGILPENDGAWKVTFNPSGENLVERTAEAPDASMPVGELTQLLLGVCTAADLPMMPRVRLLNPSAPFTRLFLPKPCHILDLF